MYKSETTKIEELKNHISIEYDKHLSYRLMDNLRNYMQHRSYPVHNITFNSKAIDKNENSEM